MRRTITVIVACTLLLVMLPACSVQQAMEITPVPTSTVSPSPTPIHTPMPTPSPIPTPSPSPTPTPLPPVEIEFEDPIVEKVIRTTLDKPEGPVTDQDMLKITSFTYDPVNDESANETIKTLADLCYCVNLDTLRVLRQPVTSIECLRGLDKIKDLCISGCSVSDLSPLAGKVALREITLNGNPVEDASPVLALPNLIEFNASYGTDITDISALPATSSLENFFCDNKLKDFSPLLRLKNLRAVTLVGISDEFFRDMVQKFRDMLDIRISDSDIKEESLKLLAGYNLYGLSLENCGLKDISGLADLACVSDLRLGGNQIEDISVLKTFTQISYYLDLSNNKIKDLSPLESIRLNSLNVMGNPYTHASITVLDELEKGGCEVYR